MYIIISAKYEGLFVPLPRTTPKLSRFKQAPKEEFMRLRINGESLNLWFSFGAQTRPGCDMGSSSLLFCQVEKVHVVQGCWCDSGIFKSSWNFINHSWNTSWNNMKPIETLWNLRDFHIFSRLGSGDSLDVRKAKKMVLDLLDAAWYPKENGCRSEAQWSTTVFVAFVCVWFLHVEYQFLEDYEIHGDTQIFRVNLWMKRDVLKSVVRCTCFYISRLPRSFPVLRMGHRENAAEAGGNDGNVMI